MDWVGRAADKTIFSYSPICNKCISCYILLRNYVITMIILLCENKRVEDVFIRLEDTLGHVIACQRQNVTQTNMFTNKLLNVATSNI